VLRQAGRSRYSIPPAAIGVLGTVLLHGAIVGSLSAGGHAPMPRLPDREGARISDGAASDSSDRLTLLSVAPIESRSESPADLVAALPAAAALTTPIQADPPAPVDSAVLPLDDERAETRAANGEGSEPARLLGIYTGQIRARIERIWRRPRSPVEEAAAGAVPADESFQCQVQITQDEEGTVREVMLPHCNGSEAWQRSLVSAIRQASPLPAPPRPSAFRRSLLLDFVGVAYAAGAPDEDYEIPLRAGHGGAACCR
jgi:hypothetical protein